MAHYKILTKSKKKRGNRGGTGEQEKKHSIQKIHQ